MVDLWLNYHVHNKVISKYCSTMKYYLIQNILSSGSSGWVEGRPRNMKSCAHLQWHLFYDLFLQGQGAMVHSPPPPPQDSLLILPIFCMNSDHEVQRVNTCSIPFPKVSDALVSTYSHQHHKASTFH